MDSFSVLWHVCHDCVGQKWGVHVVRVVDVHDAVIELVYCVFHESLHVFVVCIV